MTTEQFHPHLNPHFPLYLCFPFISPAASLPTRASFLSTLSFSFPLCRLSTHCFHVLPLSFPILTCLAHFSATIYWILYFHRSALTLPTEHYFSTLLPLPSTCHYLDCRILPLCHSLPTPPPTLFFLIPFPSLSFFSVLIKFRSHPPPSQILSGVMLEVLSEDFPEFFTAEVQMVWTKLMGAVYWHVTGAYTEVGWLQVSSSAV